MPSMQALNRRIKTAKNINQITKAMEMVSASKMRRAQAQALSSRPYSQKLYQTLQTIATLTDPSSHPLLQTHEEGYDIYVIFSTDKSLAGSLNTNLFRGTYDIISRQGKSAPLKFIIIGNRARSFALSTGYPIYAEFMQLPDPITFPDSVPISQIILKGFFELEFHSVNLIFMDFISTLTQKIKITPLLPLTSQLKDLILDPSQAIESVVKGQTTYIFEPSAQSILNWLLPYYVELTIYQTLLEAKASEHSARMVAMKNASDNASEIINELTLSYNKQRQSKITSELLENTTAANIVS